MVGVLPTSAATRVGRDRIHHLLLFHAEHSWGRRRSCVAIESNNEFVLPGQELVALLDALEELARGGLQVDDELVLTGQELVGLLHPLEEGGAHEVGVGAAAEEGGGIEVDGLELEAVVGVNGGGRGGQLGGGADGGVGGGARGDGAVVAVVGGGVGGGIGEDLEEGLLRLDERGVVGEVVEELVVDVLLHEYAGDEGQHEVLRRGGGGVAAAAVVAVGGGFLVLLLVVRGRGEVEVFGGRAGDEVGEVEVEGGVVGGGGAHVGGEVGGEIHVVGEVGGGAHGGGRGGRGQVGVLVVL
uniref:Uncharacterized protein n=1 Tax=Triticum urartu TaxID=4572 RepID=A0A8R7UG32_TRIUA